MTMNITNNHYYFPVKLTTLKHQVLIYFYHMSLYVQKGIQRVRCQTHQKLRVNLQLLTIGIFLDPLMCWFNRFLQSTEQISFEKKITSYISHNIWTICVFQPLFIVISCMCRFVSHGNFMFLLDLVSHLTYASNMFSCFQLDIDYSCCYLKTIQTLI